MSPSTDPRRDRDAGFSLLEVVVSIGLIALVMAAVAPQVMAGVKSTDTARIVVQAKGVAQGQLDRMRNMPYRVAPAAGDYRDVLDYYFRNRATGTSATCKQGDRYVVPTTEWTGYVDGAARCDYEPATGAMYRYVAPEPTAEGFVVVVSTQFLSATTPPQPVDPGAGYDTQVAGKDTPGASQIGVTVTVFPQHRRTTRPVSTYTQISDQMESPDRIEVSAGATALEVGSMTKADGAVSLSAGMLDLGGSLTHASTADATLAGVSAGLGTGAQGGGGTTTVAAPPASAARSVPGGAGTLDGTCDLACWGATRSEAAATSSEGGLPKLGAAASPMATLLVDRVNDGFSFANGAVTTRRPDLGLDGPLVRLGDGAAAAGLGLTAACGPSGAGSPAYVGASGFVDTTEEPDLVEACVLARSGTIALFPTTFAPQGVVQVELHHAWARCVVSGADHATDTSFGYRATVRHHTAGGGPAAYTEIGEISSVTPGATDPLASVPLTTPVSPDHTLGDYIAAWSSLRPGQITDTSANGVAAVSLPGVLTITSQPVRTGTSPLPTEPTTTESPTATESPSATESPTATETETAITVDLTSTVSLTLGAASCSAEDAR